MSNEKTSHAEIEDLAMAIGLLVRRIRADAPDELKDFSWTQKAVLSRLAKDGPATSAELARAEGVKPQSMGTAIAALEELGLVERKAHPTDGRQMNIKLTAKGIALRKNTHAAKHTWLANAIAKLDKKDQAVIFKAGEIIKHMAENF
jgi:DNA-binding MarR family transcriptional regulator